MFLSHPRLKVSIVGSLRDRELACSASDLQGSNFESCVWRTVSSQSSHHPQEVLLAQFSLYVYKGGLKPDSFHFSFLTPTVHLSTWYFHHIGNNNSPGAYVKAQSHIPSRTSSAQKKKHFGQCVVIRWACVRIRWCFDENAWWTSFIFVCVNLCAHFLHAQKCERFSTCESRRQKNVRPAPV